MDNYGPFGRYNDPILIHNFPELQRYWDYDHFKYTKKRDPTLEEMAGALQMYDKD